MYQEKEVRKVGRPKLADTDLKRKSLLLVIVCFVAVLALLFTGAYKLNIIKFGKMKGEISCAVGDIPDELKPNYQDPETGEVRPYGFTDPTFYSAVVNAFNGTSCSSVSLQDIENRQQLTLENKGLTNVDGIQLFKKLVSLSLNNNNIEQIDLSQNYQLSSLHISNNKLTTIDTGYNRSLRTLDVSSNKLTTLYVYYNSALQYLTASNNNLTSVFLPMKNVVTGSSELRNFTAVNNSLESIDLTEQLDLNQLAISYNNLTTLDVRANENINEIFASFNPNLSSFLYANNNSSIRSVIINSANLSGNMDLSGFENLHQLDLRNNKLSQINLSNDTALETLNLDNNQLTNVNLNNCTALDTAYIENNKLQGINVSSARSMTHLELSDNELTDINLSTNTALNWFHILNNNLKSLNLSANTALKEVDATNNKLESITLPNTSTLENVIVSHNLLKDIDISKNKKLVTLSATNNKLSSLNTNENSKLFALVLSNNEIEELNLTNNSELAILLADNNNISTISGLNNKNSLQISDLSDNKLSSVNMQGTSNIILVDLTNNEFDKPLYMLKSKADGYESNVKIDGVTTVIDDEEIVELQNGVYTPKKIGETTQTISDPRFYEAVIDIANDNTTVVGTYNIEQKIVVYDLEYGTYKVNAKNKTIDVGGITLDEVEIEVDSPTLTGTIEEDEYIIKDGEVKADVYKIINYKEVEKDKTSGDISKDQTSIIGKTIKSIFKYGKKTKNANTSADTKKEASANSQSFAGKTLKIIQNSVSKPVSILLIANTILLILIVILLALHIRKKRKENHNY